MKPTFSGCKAYQLQILFYPSLTIFFFSKIVVHSLKYFCLFFVTVFTNMYFFFFLLCQDFVQWDAYHCGSSLFETSVPTFSSKSLLQRHCCNLTSCSTSLLLEFLLHLLLFPTPPPAFNYWLPFFTFWLSSCLTCFKWKMVEIQKNSDSYLFLTLSLSLSPVIKKKQKKWRCNRFPFQPLGSDEFFYYSCTRSLFE